MRVTVCELSDEQGAFKKDWELLKDYLVANQSDLVLLPELPFHEWIAGDKEKMHQLKQKAVDKHEEWLARLGELGVDMVVYTKPVLTQGKYHNSAFLWKKGDGHYPIHAKHHFPNEEMFWEGELYSPDENGFQVFTIGELKIGILICSEVWFTEHARSYGEQNIDLLLCPRATGAQSVPQWVRCGQTLSVISGAYCLSSNKTGVSKSGFKWGGNGWISQPLDGELIGTTNESSKFFTAEIDLSLTKAAKKDYPLNVYYNGKSNPIN